MLLGCTPKQAKGWLDIVKLKHDIYWQIADSLFEKEFKKKLKPVESITLLAIASLVDEWGNCCISHKQVAEVTGLSVVSVSGAIKKLLTEEVGGMPVLASETVDRKTFYHIHWK